MDKTKPLLLERGLNWLFAKASEYKIPLLSSVLFGMLAYGFSFTNKLVNHDEVQSLFEKGATFSSGRWGLEICEKIFPNISMPWIYGLVSISMLAAAVCLLIHIFSIRSHLLQILLAGSILTFPSLTSTMVYTFTVSSFSFALFWAVAAVAFLRTQSKTLILPALVCMVFSLSIYQSYISLTAGLLVLILIQSLLKGTEIRSVLKQGTLYLLFLAVSLGCYYAATQLILRVIGVGFNSYAAGSMSLSLAEIPGKIQLAYVNFFRFFTEGYQGLMPTALSRGLHWVLLLGILVLLLLNGLKQDWRRLLLLAALVGILPLAMNCMYLFTTEDAVHTLVLYGFVTFYVLAAVLAELVPEQGAALRRLCLEGSSLAMALILVGNIYIANMVSLNLYLRYENAHAFYTALVADIQMQPGFDENTKLAVIGSYQNPEFYYYKFDEATSLTGTTGFLPDNYSKNRFVEYYIGFPIDFAANGETEALKQTPEFQEMARYPHYGSMRMIGDTLVVKLS